jgi:AcrR family transcriptional regulator
MSDLNPTSASASGSELARPDRRLRRSSEIRERLFRAALQLFAEKGFPNTTVEDITEAADVGKGTFFNYFPSKDHILLAFAEMQLGKLEAAIAEARKSAQPMAEFLWSLPGRMTQAPTSSPAIIRMLLLAYLSTGVVREEMTTIQKRVHGLHTQIMQLGQERGEIRTDVPATELAHVFRQTVFGTMLLWSLHGDASLPERMRTALHVLWSGLAPRQKTSVIAPDASGDSTS